MADPELRKAFSELQIKMIENNQRVRIAESQVAALHREITKSQLTDEELLKLPSGTKTYESVGRMFILHPTKKIRDGLKKNRVETEEKIKAIKTQVTYWEKEVHSSEESLRDLVMQKR